MSEPTDMYDRALARLDDLDRHGMRPGDYDATLKLLRALLVERRARYTTLGHEEDAAKAATQCALREFAEGCTDAK